ncbi:MAG: hypothetical protein ACI89J_001104 [Hyphomicrobiaceae bacterium]|jgi:hypothetical protein
MSNPNSIGALDEAAASSPLSWSWAPYAAFIMIWFAFAWPWITGKFTIPWDGKAHFAPQIQFMAASFGRGEWPWWTPNVFAGHPQVADPQSLLFSPPFVMLALFDSAPGPWAIDLVVLLALLAAGLGVLWLARELNWHWAGALIAAIGFAFGAAMAWRLQHFGQVLSLAYLPFTILFLRRAILQPSITNGALAGLFAAFIVLGRDQVGLLCVYLLTGYAIALILADRSITDRLRAAFLPLATGAVVAALLVTIPILLSLALAEHSNRPAIAFQDAAAGSLHPALMITGLAPHLFGAAGEMRDYWGPPSFYWENTGLYLAQNMGLVYIGGLALILLLIGTVRGLLWHRDIRFFTIAWIAVTLYAFGWYTPVFRAMYELLPGASFYRRPADAVFLIGAIGALLAGYVIHRLLSESLTASTPKRATIVAVGTALLILFALAVTFAIIFGRLEQALLPLLLAAFWLALSCAALTAALWLTPIRPLLAGSLLVAVAASDLIINNGPNGASALPSATLAMLEPDARDPTIATLKRLIKQTDSPQRRDRIEMVGLGYNWPNTPLTHKLHSTLGANPVRLNHYVAATGAGDTVAEGGQRAFPPLFPSYNSPLANLLGLRFIVTSQPIETIDKSLAPDTFKLVAQTPKARIYENPHALPRVLFAHRSRPANFADIIKTGQWPTTDFTSTVLLEATAHQSSEPQTDRRPGTITIQSYRNTVITLKVDSPDGGFAILNDVWHPWWQADVDGKPTSILKANVIFRAIKVPPGRHTVRLVFRPLLGAWSDLMSNPTASRPLHEEDNPQRPVPTQ